MLQLFLVLWGLTLGYEGDISVLTAIINNHIQILHNCVTSDGYIVLSIWYLQVKGLIEARSIFFLTANGNMNYKTCKGERDIA